MTGNMLRHLMSVLIAACAFAVGYTVKEGVSTATSSFIISMSASLVAGLFTFVYCEFLVWALPNMDVQKRLITLGLTLFVVFPITFFAVTQWSVVALGGKTGMSIHIQRTLEGANAEHLKLYEQGKMEANMAPQLNGWAQQYESLAELDRMGVYSNITGNGVVVGSLRSTAQLFAIAAKTVNSVGAEKEAMSERFQKLEERGRKIAAEMEATDPTDGDKVRQLSVEFGGVSSEFGLILTQMRESSARKYVEQIAKNLESMAMVPRDGIRPEQKAAIERLSTTVEGAKKAVKDLLETDVKVGNTAPQVFRMITPAQSIWEYPGELSFAWGMGIGFDLISYILALCSLLMAAQIKHERQDRQPGATLHDIGQMR